MKALENLQKLNLLKCRQLFLFRDKLGAGLVFLSTWIINLCATFLLMGWLGDTFGVALFSTIIWLLVDIGWLSMGSTGVTTYLLYGDLSENTI